MTVVLIPYNGRYKGHPKIIEFQDRFNEMTRNAIRKIRTDTNLAEPPVTVTIELDDDFESEPFILPSAATRCEPIPYTPEGGNCRRYGYRLGTKPIVEDYKGRTSADQIMTHELTHVYMLFNIPDHDQLPPYIIEGVPIHVAEQQGQIKAVQNDPGVNRDGDHEYRPGEIHVDDYSDIIDEYEKRFGG